MCIVSIVMRYQDIRYPDIPDIRISRITISRIGYKGDMSVYFIQNEVTKNVKIGSSDAVKTRLRQLQQGNDCPLKLIAVIEGGKRLEKQYHDAWHQYRITDAGAPGDEWFSIDVFQEGDEVKILGRKIHRAKKRKEPLRHQHCLRLNDQQEELLRRYAAFKGFKSEVNAVRAMIDGMEDWFARQEAARAEAASMPEKDDGAQQSPVIQQSITDEKSIDSIDSIDSDDDATETSVGDFAGRPAVRLPESRHDGND